MQEGIHISLKAEQVFDLAGLPITNTLLMSWLAMVILVTLAVFVGGGLRKIPGRLQIFFEVFIGFLLNYIEETLENKALARKIFPLIATLFLFILVGNWLGLIPGIGSITVTPHHEEVAHTAPFTDEHVHEEAEVPVPVAHEAEAHHEGKATHSVSLLHPMSTDLNVTLALAIVAFVVIEVLGVMSIGALKYGSKFVNFHSVIGFFVGIIELFSELARLVSFSFRLFGNMFAGKTLILVAMFFIPLMVPIPLMAYEVLVGFIQAAIFSMLTLFFVKIAVAEPH